MFLNRGFKYGDGLFETMRWHNGYIPRLELHFNRLCHGLGILGIQPIKGFSPTLLLSLINQYIEENKNYANLSCGRVRITCFRSGEGLYTPIQNQMQWCIEVGKLASPLFLLDLEGVNMGIYKAVKLSQDLLSPLKTTSALPYVMAARYKHQQPNIDDCILLNGAGNVAETIAANIFIKKNNQLYTPALTEGCVAGTMRQWIIEQSKHWNILIEETQLTLKDIVAADEIFLTNAISGLRWVQQYQNKKWIFSPQNISVFITAQLNKELEQIRKKMLSD